MGTHLEYPRRHALRFAAVALLAIAAMLSMTAVHAQGRAPRISGSPASSVKVNAYYYFQPTASDPDTSLRALRFSIANKPSWASFSIYSGKLQGSPTRAGTWSNVVIRVSDGVSSAALPAFAITASSSGNSAPTISGSPATSATVGTAYSFRPTASDANGDQLAFSIQNKPTWLSFSTANGTLSGTPAAGHVATYSNIIIKASDGKANSSLPAFSITVRAAGGGNEAPRISGTPPTSVRSGAAYAFTPTASDANGDTLTFSIRNKPAWASFSTATGRLSGTPDSTRVGTYSNVTISVSDGKTSATLPAFNITVTDVASGSTTLSWTPPTRNTDGSTLTNLAGYRIYYGTSSGSMTQRIQIANPGIASYVVSNLTPATWYFSVRAYSAAGAESAASNVATKTVR